MGAVSTKRDAERGEKLIVKNRRASFDYTIEASYEAGIALVGGEVKSLREGRVNIVDAFAVVERGELWLRQLTITPSEYAKAYPHEPRRPRKLLLHKREIRAIERTALRQGYTLVPLRLYFKGGRVKIEIGLAKGKKTVDKRREIAKKTADRDARAAMKARR